MKTLSLISVPFDLGAGRHGVSLGPDSIMTAGLERCLQQMRIPYVQAGKVPVPLSGRREDGPAALKHLSEVAAVSGRLASFVSSAVSAGHFPLVLGGDHSIAIGTIAGLADHYERLGVIWFDAHADLNTEHTSPSGNIHGMSLAVSLGMGHPSLTGIGKRGLKIKPERVVLIGQRQLDPGEREFIRSRGITCFTMHEIDRMGMARVMEEAIHIVSRDADGVHLSFDVDSLDPHEAPGTGTPVNGGVSYREAHFALELLAESGIVTSAEFVEVNPTLDHGNQTARLAVELICSLLGKRIL